MINQHHLQSIAQHIMAMDQETLDLALRGIARYLYDHGVANNILDIAGLDDLFSYIEHGCTSAEANQFSIRLPLGDAHKLVGCILVLVGQHPLIRKGFPERPLRERLQYVADIIQLSGVAEGEVYNVFGSLLGMQTLLNRVPTMRQVHQIVQKHGVRLIEQRGDDLVGMAIPIAGEPRIAVTMLTGGCARVPPWIDLELDGITYLVPIECRETNNRPR